MINLSQVSSLEEYLRLTGAIPAINPLWCCEPPEPYAHSLDNVNGYWTCFVCGLIKEQILDDQYHQEGMYNATQGVNPGFNYAVYRPYKPLNHFREHLRRFLGSRPTQMNLDLLHVNVLRRDAYYVIKKQLKKLKMRHEYKNIWSILYLLGGKTPKMENDVFHECSRLFFEFSSKYEEFKGIRKSIPNHDMLLSAIFEKIGYDSYYKLPIIQSRKIRENIYYIIKQCLG
jgi:hypothetical protein